MADVKKLSELALANSVSDADLIDVSVYQLGGGYVSNAVSIGTLFNNSSASTTYLTISNAASTYDTIINASNHTNNSFIHFTEGSIDHTNILNIGSNSHADIDIALIRLADTSGENTGDQDLTPYLTISNASSEYLTISNAASTYLTDAPSDGSQYARQNNTWSVVTGYSNAVGDTRYLMLDTSNGPLTGNLEISKADPNITLTDSGDGNSATWTRSDTDGKVSHKNVALTVAGSAISNQEAHYLMNDNAASTTLIDAEGNYNGTITGGNNSADLTTTGKINAALVFDGSADGVDLGASIIDVSSDFSVAFWMNPVSAVSTTEVVLCNGDVGTTGFYGRWNGGKIGFAVNGVYGTTVSVSTGTWTHIIFVRTGGTNYIYKNNDAGTIASTTTPKAATKNTYLCRRDTDNTLHFEGSLDDVRFFSKALSADERSLLYNSGSGTENNSGFLGFLVDVEQTYITHEDGSGSGEAGILTLGHTNSRNIINSDFGTFLNDNVYMQSDTDKLYFGAGDDASIYYDGSDLIIDSDTDIRLSNLTDNGFVKTSGGDGTLSVDTTEYLSSSNAVSTYLTISNAASTYISDYTYGLTVDGSGSQLTTGIKGYVTIPMNIELLEWYIVAKESGAVIIDINNGIGGNSIVGGGNRPTLISQQNSSANVTSWDTTTLNQGDLIEFEVDSASTVTWVNLIVKARKI